MEPLSTDDPPTLAALGVIAFALANVSHEGLGHGLATLAVGDKALFLCTCYFDSSGYYSKWIPAAGGLMNLAVGFGSLAALRLSSRPPLQASSRSSLQASSRAPLQASSRSPLQASSRSSLQASSRSPLRLSPPLRYFLLLVAAFNLFFAFGYPAYSGISLFGDWASVISGLKPQWPWRALLVLVSIAGYYATMKLLAKPLAPFVNSPNSSASIHLDKARLLRITLIPYIAAMVVACLAGALNPKGWVTMLTSGLPAAAAAFGLTQMDHFIDVIRTKTSHEVIAPLQRSLPWIIAAVVVLIFFIGILGPGIHFR